MAADMKRFSPPKEGFYATRRWPRVVDVAVAQGQGPRDHMEDFVRVESAFTGRSDRLYVGVFDGHGGEAVAHRAAGDLHGLLAAELQAGLPPAEAFRRAFQTFDDSVAGEQGGAVAGVLVLEGDRLWVANTGDVTILLVSEGTERVLSGDHRLTNEGEYARLKAAGAIIRAPYAFMPGGEGLMPTRSLGDRPFRSIGVLATPDVTSLALTPRDSYIVVGSDGVFDPLEASTVARLARASNTANLAADRIISEALALGDDNVTVVAIRR